MSKYLFNPTVLTRTPLYSHTQYDIKNMHEILQTPSFQAALYLASQSFFNELKKKDFDYSLLSAKQQHTIGKYLNRACFRSTPFGLFSSFCPIPWSTSEEVPIILSRPHANVTLDFSLLQNLWTIQGSLAIRPTDELQTNPSLYKSSFDFRYIKTSINEDKVQFSMVSLPLQSFLKKLTCFCAKPKTYDVVKAFLNKETGASSEEIENFVIELISQQVIILNNSPRVTGNDYAHTVNIALTEKPNLSKEIFSLHHTNLHVVDSPKLLNELVNFSNEIQTIYPGISKENHFYSLSNRSISAGGLPPRYQKSLQEGIFLWSVLSPESDSHEIIQFKEAFKKKYEDEEVPLLEILDPQLGIGYGEFEQIQNTYGFSDDRQNSSGFHSPATEFQSSVTALLLNDWEGINTNKATYEVTISDEQIKQLLNTTNGILPPSISVLFRTMGDKVYIESCGGPSALSLIGRFSFHEGVFDIANAIATQEQTCNPDVVFAELAHVCNLHTANIDRRPHLRDFEIPVLTPSAMEENQQIPLSDLMVSVIGNAVILRSITLGKRVIPRLSSAFNFTKNSLPLFRFLCDVQNQQLKAGFSFSFASLLPGLSFYPRVVYKSCVIHLAEWHLEANQFFSQSPISADENFVNFQKLSETLRVPRYFAYVQGDNFLVFDRHRRDDIFFFLEEIRNKGQFILREFPFTENSMTREDAGQPLVAQYVASLHLQEKVYSALPVTNNSKRKIEKKKDTQDWLYLKIYCHLLSTNLVLINYILPLIKKEQKAGHINQWFWVRYKDPQEHIRLRIMPNNCTKSSVGEKVINLLTKLLTRHLVAAFQPAVYRRELERYSSQLILDVELIFMQSSQVLANHLQKKHQKGLPDELDLWEAVLSLQLIMTSFRICSPDQKVFSKYKFDHFFNEFGKPHHLKREIEQKFKVMQAQKNMVQKMISQASKRYEPLERGIAALVLKYEKSRCNSPTLEKLAADIIHMHLNRLFSQNQRYLEMIAYYLVYRRLSVESHTKRPNY